MRRSHRSARRIYGPSFLLKDEFLVNRAAGAVNGTVAEPGPGGARTVVDTANLLSITGGVLRKVSGAALASLRLPGVTRAPGILGLIRILHNALPANKYHVIGWGDASMGNGGQATLYLYSSTLYDTSGSISLTPIVISTTYTIAITLRATGYLVFIKGGIFLNWTLLFVSATGNVATQYLGYRGENTTQDDVEFLRRPLVLWMPTPLASDGFGSAFGLTDGLGHAEGVAGGIGAGGGGKQWTGATWATAAGVAYNVPSVGAEQTVNPDFEGTFTGGVANGYSNTMSAPAQSASVHSGAKAQQFQGGAQFAEFNQSFQCYIGDWAVASMWVKAVGGHADVAPYIFDGVNWRQDANVTSSVYTQVKFAYRQLASHGTGGMHLSERNLAGPYDVITTDDWSYKVLSLPSLFASLQSGTQDPYASVNTTVAVYAHGGVVLNLDSANSPANFILAYYDRFIGKVMLDKCLAGVYTNLLNVAATYAAGGLLTVRKVGLVYYVFYNNAYIGNWTANSGTDAPILNNTLHGLFSTGSGSAEVSLDNFVCYPSGSMGEFNSLDRFSR